MGHAITFDTLAYAKKLIAVGVPAQQAEAQAETFAEIIEERLSTKQDLKELEITLKQYLDIRINETKADIIKWVAAMLVAQAAIVATLVKLL
ncbi:MAG: DUF1640 domain-containing protein [Bacteroidota bacterium]